jgi:hypothetical protein
LTTGIHYAEYLIVAPEAASEVREAPGERLHELNLRPPKNGERVELLLRGDDFPHAFEAVPERLAGRQRRLGGGAEDDRRPVLTAERLQRLQTGAQELDRQHLGFVEDDDAAHNVV